ncbi:MAG: STN domain-containing protein, partial [Spirochaetes bacterium]|nr:STN domain-containing protein [Spirochaetota bacterium]
MNKLKNLPPFMFIKKTFLFLLFLSFISFQTYSVQKIDNLSFTQTEITEILKVISEIFSITIVPDRDITGKVTRYFKDTTLEETLTYLLEPLGFVYEIKNGIYFVHKKPLFKVIFDENTRLYQVTSNNGSLQN